MSRKPFVSLAACLGAAVGLAAAGGCSSGGAPSLGPVTDAAPRDGATKSDTGVGSFHDAAPLADAGAHEAASLEDAPTGDSSSSPGPDEGAPVADSGAPPEASPPPPPPTSLDLHDCTIFDNPVNLADWPVTTQITDVEFQYQGNDGVHVEFSKQNDPGSWPDVTPPGWNGPLQYTLGFCEYIGGHWYGSAAIQYWRGLAQMGGNVAQDIVTMGQCAAFGASSTCQVAKNWYYDGRWGNLQGYQPATGEWIGVFVAAGNLRDVTDGSQSPVQERSNVVLVQMPDINGANYTF
jgi:hypothetical protein